MPPKNDNRLFPKLLTTNNTSFPKSLNDNVTIMGGELTTNYYSGWVDNHSSLSLDLEISTDFMSKAGDLNNLILMLFGEDIKVELIERVIFNDPATVIIWADNTKTVVKCQNGDKYDPEKGFAMALVKKMCGNKGNYYNIFTKVFKRFLEVD